ncbi:hypothetical protein CANCADRAFT_55491 [Tortispora caseinolytica NRRL Y-17796]|uniref:Uncharacterized protein n=1 Tax=Tortispora caseinolytica NRRL Y-17796 TaxID=767744 RepID=A0A1E4TIR6_9ASCO|nr:hypothetical protein CANCADRAFT_55491 [Tortispora caseinolytica NRRL Y-17796]
MPLSDSSEIPWGISCQIKSAQYQRSRSPNRQMHGYETHANEVYNSRFRHVKNC